MPKTPTQKSRFPSRYSPNAFVTPAQYICEFVCENAARKQDKDLPIKFWEIETWANFFKSQIKAINLLLTKYPDYVIIRVLRTNPKIISLRPKWVHELIGKEFLLEQKKHKEEEIKAINKKLVSESPREQFVNNKKASLKSILR